MSYRLQVLEKDFSGFVTGNVDETGAMVVISSKGPNTPLKCSSELEVLTRFGYPSSTYPSVFDAVSFCKAAPCQIASAYNSDATWGGIDVLSGSVVGFSAGRDLDTFDYGAVSGDVSHSFFTVGPQADDLAGSVKYISGSQFKLTLYQVLTTGNSYLTEYNYSLIREKDNYGRSLYIDDVFDDNDYVVPKVNANRTITSYSLPGTTIVAFDGGSRGSTPLEANVTTAWSNFKYPNKYPVKIVMDALGGYDSTINTLITTYQPYAHGLTIIPMGNNASEAIAVRNGSVIDSDNISYYTNWARIEDPYNNSSAWISNIGSIGKKYALMNDVYDALSPAGIDENNHGGQLTDWKVLEVEEDYNDSELQLLDEAQINPVILDDIYGLMAYGDKTAQVSNSDTSFIGTRRLYNYIIDKITKQVLRKQEFKNNDEQHRLKARLMTQSFLEPIVAQGLFREIYVQCDENNNTDYVLEQRKFILDIYVKITPNSQFVTLRLTRISQTQTIAEFL